MNLLSPLSLEFTVLVLGICLFLFEMFAERVDKKILAWIGIAGLSLVFAVSFYAGFPPEIAGAPAKVEAFRTFYSADALAMFFKRFALLTTIVVLVMSVDYLPVVRKFTPGATAQGGLGEFLALPILTCAGLMWMASAVDFVMIFVSLELVTISFYVLVTYTRRNAASLEAGVKYLILGALSTGFFVYGITWIFGITGQTNLAQVRTYLATAFPAGFQGSTAPVMFSFILIMIALGFKVAAVPFQIWVPDVYQGAPTPVAAFLSVGSKAAGFVVFLRVLDAYLGAGALVDKISLVLAVMAGATLVYGNLAALPQNNLKRMLAYSSVAHAGYLLVAVASAAHFAPGAESGLLSVRPTVAFYLAAYLPMTLLSFLAMIVVANHSAGDDIADFNGLGKRSPFLAFAMLIAMASLAGVPFTVGFFGKFFVFATAIAHHQYVLVGIGVVAVACGFYYYLRVVRAIYFEPVPADTETIGPIQIGLLTRVTIALLIVSIIVLGVYPRPALGLAEETVIKPVVAGTAAVPVATAGLR